MTSLTDTIPRPRSTPGSLAVDAALIVGGSLLIAALAQVTFRVPFTPVPITGQTLGVLLIAAPFGWARAGLTLALYLAQIAVGLPFAADGRGGLEILTLATASGGYLWGFLAAAVLVGSLANQGWDRSISSSISAMLLGTIVIYAFGVPWLAASIDVPVSEALELGMYPFVIGDVLKLLLAAVVFPGVWKLVRRTP
ncbi:MAG TPA: biotin transporter BioY [Actinomycetota bacterium]|nr:biotin transporter BioY [Actinomycetota bacterium]